MALHANSSVVTAGLVFNVDTANSKSYAGEKLTNLVPDAKNMTGWSPYSSGNDGTFATEFGTVGYRVTKRGSWNGLYRGISLPNTGTYTFSAWYRYLGGSSNNNGGTVYISGTGLGYDVAASVNKSLVGVWQRISYTVTCTNTSVTFYLISYGGTSGADNCSWEVTMPQVEAKSYATPWVNGTRLSTQSFRDTGGTTTITPNAITYNSDSTFTLGSGYWQADQTKSTSITFMCWAKTTNAVTSNMMFNAGPAGTGPDLYFSGSGMYWNTWDGSGNPIGSTPASANDGTYHHYVLVNNSADSTAKFYYDGALIGTGGYRTAANNTTMYIGGAGGGGYPWNGTIGQFQIYNRATTATEVLYNFNTQKTRFGR